jgi:hypothetical protein
VRSTDRFTITPDKALNDAGPPVRASACSTINTRDRAHLLPCEVLAEVGCHVLDCLDLRPALGGDAGGCQGGDLLGGGVAAARNLLLAGGS